MNHDPTLTHLVGVARHRDLLREAERDHRAASGRRRRLPAITIPAALRWPVRTTAPRAVGRSKPAESL